MSTTPITGQFIRLDFAGQSLTFNVFLDSEYPRKKAEMIEIGRTAYGAFRVAGRSYEDWHEWSFSTLIDFSKKDVLEAMYWEHHNLRRRKSVSPTPDILLTDCTQMFVERSPRSRARAGAPFANEEYFGTNPQFISYYAKYYVYFAREPQFSKQDEKLKVILSFVENDTSRKVPTFLDG